MTALLAQAGWLVQDREDINLTASDAIAVREFKLEKGHRYVDYLLFSDGNAVGVVEAKPQGSRVGNGSTRYGRMAESLASLGLALFAPASLGQEGSERPDNDVLPGTPADHRIDGVRLVCVGLRPEGFAHELDGFM